MIHAQLFMLSCLLTIDLIISFEMDILLLPVCRSTVNAFTFLSCFFQLNSLLVLRCNTRGFVTPLFYIPWLWYDTHVPTLPSKCGS